jgi:hypothetical protein
MRTQWTKKHDGLVESGDFDPGRVAAGGEVQTLNGGFTDLSGLKSRLRERGEEEQWADLVVMAQAWHWAHPDYDAAIVSAPCIPNVAMKILLMSIVTERRKRLPRS